MGNTKKAKDHYNPVRRDKKWSTIYCSCWCLLRGVRYVRETLQVQGFPLVGILPPGLRLLSLVVTPTVVDVTSVVTVTMLVTICHQTMKTIWSF